MIDRLAEIARESMAEHAASDLIDPGDVLLETTSKATIVYFLAGETGGPVLVAKVSHGERFDEGMRAEAERMIELRKRSDEGLGIPFVHRIIAVEERTVILMAPAAGKNMAVMIHPFSLRPVSILKRHFDLALAWLLRFREILPPESDDRVPVHGDFGPRNIHVGPDGEVSVVDWEYFQEAGGAYHDPCHFVLLYTWLHYMSRSGLDAWGAWTKGLTGGGSVARAARQFLSGAVPDCRGKEGVATVLRSYGEEIFAGRDRLSIDPIIRAEPKRWEALLRAVLG